MLGFVYTQLNMALADCACALKGYPGKGFLGLPGYSCHCRGDRTKNTLVLYSLHTDNKQHKITLIIALTAQFSMTMNHSASHVSELNDTHKLE